MLHSNVVYSKTKFWTQSLTKWYYLMWYPLYFSFHNLLLEDIVEDFVWRFSSFFLRSFFTTIICCPFFSSCPKRCWRSSTSRLNITWSSFSHMIELTLFYGTIMLYLQIHFVTEPIILWDYLKLFSLFKVGCVSRWFFFHIKME